MTNYERYVKALEWQSVDRILTYDFIDNTDLLMRYGNYKKGNDYTFEDLLHINCQTFKNIGLDIARTIYDPVNPWIKVYIETWTRFLDVNPEGWEVSQKGGTGWISKRPFSNLHELEKHMPNFPTPEEVKDYYVPFYRHMKEVFDHYDLIYCGILEGPLVQTYNYMDMELFSYAIYDAPELVAHFLDCMGKFSAYMAQAYAETAPSPLIFMGEDTCGSNGPIFSPDFIREQVLPRWQWIINPIKEKGLKFLYHSDGRYGPILSIIFDELDADGIHPIERNGCNDIFKIRKMYPNKMLFGNVCCEVTLPLGNIYDVEDETLELIERIGPQGGLFIGSSSELHNLVPVENALRLYETVREYGLYPIDIDKIKKRRIKINDRLTVRSSNQIEQ